jgi:glycosyltransferase involved in cell wall biosynthesis
VVTRDGVGSILLLTRYGRNGSSSRIRCCNYISSLRHAGFEITNASFFGDDYLNQLYQKKPYNYLYFIRDYAKRVRRLLTVKSYDLIWVEKEVLPWLPAWFERTLLSGIPVVVDYDDAWSLRYAEHHNFFIRRLLPRKLETIVKNATIVIAGNPVIADWARKSGASRVVEIPTVVDLTHYPVKPIPDGPFTVGWIGTPVTESYLKIIAGPLRQIQKKFGARIRIIGGSQDFSIEGVNIDLVPWCESTEASELGSCHVGVMPLNDAPWEQGKCGYKLIQYMASARATVASPVGFNRTIVSNNHTGFFATSPDDWVGALSVLATDPELLRNFGRAGRKRVEERFSLNVLAPKIVQLFCDLLPQELASAYRESAATSSAVIA